MLSLTFFDVFALASIAIAVAVAVAFAWDCEHIPPRGGFRVERYVNARR